MHSAERHLAPVIARANGDMETLAYGGPPIGVLRKAEYVSSESRLDPGDRLVPFTDGISESHTGLLM